MAFEYIQDMLITGVWFRICCCRSSSLCNLVCERSPFIFRVVYYRLRYFLTDNALHYLIDHFLFFCAFFSGCIVGLDFIPEVPVRQQYHVVGEDLAAVVGSEFPHADVVFGNVHLGVSGGKAHCLADFGRHP